MGYLLLPAGSETWNGDSIMTMKNKAVVSFLELRYLSLECAACSTRLVLDVKAENRAIPEYCPGCHREFGSAKNAVGAFVRAFNSVEAASASITFEIDAHP